MIYFGKQNCFNKKYGIFLEKRDINVKKGVFVPNYYIGFRWGHKNWYIGMSRLKRIVRGWIYELDGKVIKYKSKR